jgi:hypothetical protein
VQPLAWSQEELGCSMTVKGGAALRDAGPRSAGQAGAPAAARRAGGCDQLHHRTGSDCVADGLHPASVCSLQRNSRLAGGAVFGGSVRGQIWVSARWVVHEHSEAGMCGLNRVVHA